MTNFVPFFLEHPVYSRVSNENYICVEGAIYLLQKDIIAHKAAKILALMS